MTLSKLPSGRWRARVWDASKGKDVPVAPILGLKAGTTWETKREAKAAREEARGVLRGFSPHEITVGIWWKRWTTSRIYQRPKESTNIHNRERTKAFAERYADMRLSAVTRNLVQQDWLAGGNRNGTVSALRAMFNDAVDAELIVVNPFARLKIQKTKGNRYRQPPSREQLEKMFEIAREYTPPSFAAYLEFACATGARPSELDALRWERIRFDDGEIDLFEQWNAKTHTFTPPKYGPYTVALVGRARDILLQMRRDSDGPFVFVTTRGTHYTPTSRIYHWNRVRAAAGLPNITLYLAARHYFATYALNVLGLPPHVVAVQLGHRDGGRLVVQLCGHPDEALARKRIREAYDEAATVTPLRLVRKETG